MATLIVSGLINIETTVRIDGFPLAYSPVLYPFGGVYSGPHVADKEDALEGLDRSQLIDAVRKFLFDWKSNGGSVDALFEEAAERNDFRVQAPSEIYVTPFPLVMRCAKCGVVENHDKPRRAPDLILASTHDRISGSGGNARIAQRCGS